MVAGLALRAIPEWRPTCAGSIFGSQSVTCTDGIASMFVGAELGCSLDLALCPNAEQRPGGHGADCLAVHLGLGTAVTDRIMLTPLIASLLVQLRARQYVVGDPLSRLIGNKEQVRTGLGWFHCPPAIAQDP